MTFSDKLKDFTCRFDKRRGHDIYVGVEDNHDDLVMVTALPIWYATRNDKHGKKFNTSDIDEYAESWNHLRN